MGKQTKTCTKCGETKPLSGFSKNKSKKHGVQSQCKVCMRACELARYQSLPVREVKEGQTETCTKCGETKPVSGFNKNKRRKSGVGAHCKVCIKAYYQANKDRISSYHRKRNYGLEPEQVEEMWLSQKGKCLICEVNMVREGTGGACCCVDHCHTTGKVRGLLCSHCNRGIGCLKDSTDILRKAIEYLDNRSPKG